MKNYTVIGYYDDDGMTFAETVNASDHHAAMQAVATQQVANGNTGLCIIGALVGEHELHAPGEGNYMSAFVQDLAGCESEAANG